MGKNVQIADSSDLDMSFEAFTELYINDVKNRLKENTWLYQRAYHTHKDTLYFGKLKISEIWPQRRLLLGRMKCLPIVMEKKSLYSQTYLKNAAQSVVRHFQSRCPLL